MTKEDSKDWGFLFFIFYGVYASHTEICPLILCYMGWENAQKWKENNRILAKYHAIEIQVHNNENTSESFNQKKKIILYQKGLFKKLNKVITKKVEIIYVLTLKKSNVF